MKTLKYYEKSLLLINEIDTYEYTKIATKLAAINPKLFVEIALDIRPDLIEKNKSKEEMQEDQKNKMETINQKAIAIAKSEGLVPAIKYVRQAMGVSLKEAKEHIDSLTTEFKR